AHARRKFVEVYKTTQSPFAREVIERLQAVYAIEAEIRGSSAEQRLATRGTRSAPLMEALRTRLTAMAHTGYGRCRSGGDGARWKPASPRNDLARASGMLLSFPFSTGSTSACLDHVDRWIGRYPHPHP
ncbi:IS66 family transposase, partial [Bradyrhizobium brasilense]|uniref:IS66 family transposase n=1 Tax=Bradyrhizobium brasilense TaxID=1419277 RepID=UPI003D30FB11